MSRNCCRAFTAECMSCVEGITEDQYCSRQENKDVVGCEKYVSFSKISNIQNSLKRINNL